MLPDVLAEADIRFDVVVEASGNPSGWELAVKKVKPRGTIVLKSTYHGALSFNPAPLVIEEITVVGSRCGPFEPALRLLSSGLGRPQPAHNGGISFFRSGKGFSSRSGEGYSESPPNFLNLPSNYNYLIC